MSKRPWARAPWAIKRVMGTGEPMVLSVDGEVDLENHRSSHPLSEADAALIALAPEMAEAILNHDPHEGGVDKDFVLVRMKLEMLIGAGDE